jgi:hypothetical protein
LAARYSVGNTENMTSLAAAVREQFKKAHRLDDIQSTKEKGSSTRYAEQVCVNVMDKGVVLFSAAVEWGNLRLQMPISGVKGDNPKPPGGYGSKARSRKSKKDDIFEEINIEGVLPEDEFPFEQQDTQLYQTQAQQMTEIETAGEQEVAMFQALLDQIPRGREEQVMLMMSNNS